MKNVNTMWLWSIGIVLILLNLYSLFERNKAEQINEKIKVEKSNLANKLHHTQDNILKRTILQFKSEDHKIDVSLTLKTPLSDDTMRLSEVLKNNKVTLVFKYSDINCQVCVDQVFAKINSFTESVGEKSVLYLAAYKNVRDLYTFQRVNNIDQTIYNIGEQSLGLPAEEASVPVLFLAYPDGNIDYVFLPDKSIPKLTEQYFQFIKSKF